MLRKIFDRLTSLLRNRFDDSQPRFGLQDVRQILSQHHAMLMKLYGVPLCKLEAEALKRRLAQADGVSIDRNMNAGEATSFPGNDWAVFTPLPPVASGIADYARELAGALGKRLNVTYVIADDAPDPGELTAEISVVRLSEWLSDTRRDLSTPRLYHFGNSIVHEYMIEESRRRPGVVVLHDMVLHHLFEKMAENEEGARLFRSLAQEQYGQGGTELADLAGQHLSGDAFRFGMTFNAPVLQNALGVIVHSFESLYRIRDEFPEVPSRRIPMLYSRDGAASSSGRVQAKEQSEIDSEPIVFAALGMVTTQKRVDLLIRALASIKNDIPPFQLRIVGELPEYLGLRELAAQLGIDQQLHATGRLDMNAFQANIDASSVVVNLRFPSAGETSATMIRAMGAAKPCVVFDYGTTIDYSDDCLVKIPLNVDSHVDLANTLKKLACDPERSRQCGVAAAKHIREEHQIEDIAEAYARFMSSIALDDRGTKSWFETASS